MDKNDALVPIEQQLITFYNDQITVIQSEDGTVYVPIRPICDLLGVSWPAQSRKLKSDPVLSKVQAPVAIKQQVNDSRGHITTEMLALPLDYLNGWLFGINVNRVKDEIRETLMRYQMECYRVLSEAFVKKEVTVQQDDELMQSSEPSAIAFRNALAVARLARQQYYLEKQVVQNTGQIAEMGQRLSLLEANMSDPRSFVTQEQAQLISEGVKMIAGVLSKESNKNEYGGTYVELYRRFGVTSYKHIPAGRFDETMNWLRNWYTELTDDSKTPF